MSRNPMVDHNGLILPEDEARHVLLAPHLTTGIAVFETLRAYTGPDADELFVFRLHDHLARLDRSMDQLAFRDRPAITELSDRVLSVIRANDLKEDCHVRIYVYPESLEPVLGPVDRVGVIIGAAPRPPAPGRTTRAAISKRRRADDEVFPARIKCTANYAGSRMALIEARAIGADDAIMLNRAGGVAEAPIANLFIVEGGRLVTPDIGSGILQGITRATLLALTESEAGLEASEEPIEPARLRAADEVFLCSTGYEIRPVVAIGDDRVGDGEVGPITTHLHEEYLKIVRGHRTLAESWRAPVYRNGTADHAM